MLANDRRVIGDIYKRYAPAVKRYVLANNGSLNDASDIFGEALTDIRQQARYLKFTLSCLLEPLLFLMCKQKWQARPGHTLPLKEVGPVDESVAGHAERLRLQAEELERTWRVLGKLGLSCQDIIRNTLSGPPLENIAGLLAVTPGYLRKKKAECMALLLQALKTRDEQEDKQRLSHLARYAEGDMDAIEKAEFEYELMKDAGAQQQLADYRHIHSLLQIRFSKSGEDHAFKAILRELSAVYFSMEHKRSSPLRKYALWLLAAAVLFVIFIIWAPWRKDLYSQYSGARMEPRTGRAEFRNPRMINAAEAFNHEDFSTATAILKDISREQPENSLAKYYYGLASLQAGEISTSRRILSEVYHGNSAYKYEAAFYLALGYLKEEDEQTCSEWLKKIPADAAIYKKSSALLKELE